MLQRVSAMQSELDTLVESIRTGANRVSADLALLEGNMAELYSAAGARPEAPAEPEPPLPAPEPFTAREPAAPAAEEPEELEPEPAGVGAEDIDVEVEAEVEDDADVEGARLIALNMALNGQSREETDRYLAENFDLPDRQRLLDEVYSSVES